MSLDAPQPRIGCVPYLNALPLLEGIEFPVEKAVPARLYDAFTEGRLDVALLSSIDLLTSPQPEVVDGVCIGSQGDVHSVVLAYEGELKALRRVALDPASHTSNALLRIILKKVHGLEVEYVQYQEGMTESLPRLLIGDPAISFRKRTSSDQVRYLDLGGEWYRATGLPFVFALWVVANDFTDKKSLSESLRRARDLGLASLPKLVEGREDPDFALRYLGGMIRYDLGPREKEGLQLFARMVCENTSEKSKFSDIIYW